MKSDTECVCIYIHTHHSIYRFLYTYTTFGFPSMEAFNLLKFKSHRQKKTQHRKQYTNYNCFCINTIKNECYSLYLENNFFHSLLY